MGELLFGIDIPEKMKDTLESSAVLQFTEPPRNFTLDVNHMEFDDPEFMMAFKPGGRFVLKVVSTKKLKAHIDVVFATGATVQHLMHLQNFK